MPIFLNRFAKFEPSMKTKFVVKKEQIKLTEKNNNTNNANDLLHIATGISQELSIHLVINGLYNCLCVLLSITSYFSLMTA